MEDVVVGAPAAVAAVLAKDRWRDEARVRSGMGRRRRRRSM